MARACGLEVELEKVLTVAYLPNPNPDPNPNPNPDPNPNPNPNSNQVMLTTFFVLCDCSEKGEP